MSGKRGFTLIESVAALALVVLIASTALPAVSSLAASLNVATSARTLAQTLRETRARAVAEGAPLEVRFDAATSLWSVRTLDGTVRRSERLPGTVAFTALPVRARIRFEPTGAAENGTIVLGSAAATRRIVVNQRGRVRLA